MAGIETYGGCCPKCLKPMMQKWESSYHGFMFEACPWCGFAFGEIDTVGIESSKVWDIILKRNFVNSREDLIKLYNWTPSTKDEDELYPSIFNYSKDKGTHPHYITIQQNSGGYKK